MATKHNVDINEELERVRGKLLQINKKVNRYSRFHHTDHISAAANHHSDISLKEIHEKLHAINTYFHERVGTQVVDFEIPHVKESLKEEKERLGIGLDLGTSNVVSAREVKYRRVFIKNERNAFLLLRSDKVTKDLLRRFGMKYVVLADKMYVLGQSAFELANVFNREIQRTMSQGILNPSEIKSLPMLKLLVQNILWTPREEGEPCCFSIPASPIDKAQDTVYHKSVFGNILKELGFEPVVVDEGYAVVLSELGCQDFTGIGISCGGGLVNICAAFKSVPVTSFSISRGGDWIDKNASSVLGIPASVVTGIKEQGLNLKQPLTREHEAIAIYYRNFIHYFLENMAEVFGRDANSPRFTKPVDIVLTGGSVMVDNFLDVVKEELQSIDLGFLVGNIKKAEEPFTSVARGCLFNAVNLGKVPSENVTV